MSRIAIVTDSAANLPPELVTRYGIHVVPLKLIWDGKTYRDGVDLSASEFYQRLRAEPEQLPSTASPSVGDFLQVYNQLSRESNAVVSIHTATELSATCAVAEQARTLAEHMRIEVIDSRTGSMGCGFVVLGAARIAAEGADLRGIVEETQAIIERVRVYVVPESLGYLRRSGRVPTLAAIVGSLLDIHPIVYLKDGQTGLFEINRTQGRAMDRLIDVVDEAAAGRRIHAAVVHADAPHAADDLRQSLARRCDCVELLTTEFTPVMGSHTGPGLIGVAFYTSRRGDTWHP